MHRAITRKKWLTSKAIVSAAAFAGTLVRTIPGAGGALCVCFGFGMIYKPLAIIGIGLVLLLIDRRIP
jgi:ABC-type transport system involved in multi-copper enzyme maturation permease subunit